MAKNSSKLSKEQKLKAALRDNLKKRKQFVRTLDPAKANDEETGIKLRHRELTAKKD
ncbi:MAG: hypothetical protein AAF478_07265 [Pseudomonadota bacterium]